MTLPDMVPEKDVVGMVPFDTPNHLVGMYFFWDSAPPEKRGFYHGRVAANLDSGYYLLAFAQSCGLPEGVHEIVHVAVMAEQAWAFYLTETEYLASLAGGDDAA